MTETIRIQRKQALVKGGKSDFQDYHTIILKMQVFNKNLQGTQRNQENMAHAKEKKSIEMIPEEI